MPKENDEAVAQDRRLGTSLCLQSTSMSLYLQSQNYSGLTQDHFSSGISSSLPPKKFQDAIPSTIPWINCFVSLAISDDLVLPALLALTGAKFGVSLVVQSFVYVHTTSLLLEV